MRKLLLALAMIIILATTVNALTDSTMIYPNGAELFYEGDIIPVNFTQATDGYPIRYDLDYSSNNGGAWNSLVSDFRDFETTYTTTWCNPLTYGFEMDLMDWDSNYPDLIWMYKSSPQEDTKLWSVNITNCNYTQYSATFPSNHFNGLAHLYRGGQRYWLRAEHNPYDLNLFYDNGTLAENWFSGSGGNYYRSIDCGDEFCYGVRYNNVGNEQIAKFNISDGSLVSSKNAGKDWLGDGLVILDEESDLLLVDERPSGCSGACHTHWLYDFDDNVFLKQLQSGQRCNSYDCLDWVETGSDYIRAQGNDRAGAYYSVTELTEYDWNTTGVAGSEVYLMRVRSKDNDTIGSWDETDATFKIRNCTTSWSCNLWGFCNASDLEICIEAVDNNSCGYDYDGNYSEFGTQACDYCTPSWSCIRHINRCPTSHIKNCLTVEDANGCYLLTGLPSDDFDGDYSPYEAVCGYQGMNYTTDDVKAMSVDVIGFAGVELIQWVRILYVVLTLYILVYGVGRLLFEKLGIIKKK